MNYKVNPNLTHLQVSLRDGLRGVVLEGSSRSGKTWSSVDFIVYLCSIVETGAVINVIKETYNSFKTTMHDDFNRRLPQFGITSPFQDKAQVSSFNLLGTKINLLGADDPAKFHGAGCDYFYMNEMLDIPQSIFDQSEMRCRKFFWGDYNPKATQHWVFDKLERRPDVSFLKTTFEDNPCVSVHERNKILSYEPTHPDDRGLVDARKRRPHPTNIANGTADDYMWNVYGLGLRSAPEGLIFQHVTWVKEFPKNCEKDYYGIDWGYTNDPTVLTHIGVMGDKFFGEILFYAPTPSFNEVEPILKLVPKGKYIWADPSGEYGGRGLITLAQRNGYPVYAFNAFPGSRKFGISIMKRYKIHLIDHPDMRKEQANYKYKSINGIKLDEPIDGFDHAWDSMRGAAIANLSK